MAKHKWLGNLSALAAGALAAIALAEVLVRQFVSVRDVGPSFTVYDPVFGKRIKPSFSAMRVTPEFTMRFSSNALGFRGPEPVGHVTRPIIFLGDSFTLGYGVSDGEEYPALIGAALRRRHGDGAPAIVNAGVGDSGNGYWVKLLDRDARAMQPRLVVMQLFENDFADNAREQLFALGAGGALEERAVPPPGFMRRLQAVSDRVPGLSYSHLIGLLRQARPADRGARTQQAVGTAAGGRSDAADELTLKLVDRAIATCASRGWKVLGVLVGLLEARRSALAAIFERHGMPVVVIPGKVERPDLYYRVDGHWHAGGHAYAAERVLDAVIASGAVRD